MAVLLSFIIYSAKYCTAVNYDTYWCQPFPCEISPCFYISKQITILSPLIMGWEWSWWAGNFTLILGICFKARIHAPFIISFRAEMIGCSKIQPNSMALLRWINGQNLPCSLEPTLNIKLAEALNKDTCQRLHVPFVTIACNLSFWERNTPTFVETI